ncbi:T9SS type A sorting domain-containing protein [candidate division KSB1 bacterium]|nr:T9SS type A sorting domain-containing protein [candidate division KSB1 bacterium]
MPIDIGLWYNTAWHEFVAWDSLESQHFQWIVDGQPTNLRFDHDEWVLCTKTQVSMPAEVTLSHLDHRVEDSLGNGNMGADPGETVNLYVRLMNQGWNEATAVFGELSSSDPYIEVIGDTSSYPEIAGYQAQENLDLFIVQIVPSCPTDYGADMQIQVTAAGGYSQDVNFTLLIGDPRLLPVGPDAYGYIVLDPHDSGGPTFEWIEISPSQGGPGTAIEFTADDQTVPVPLPFPFTFYGQSGDTLSVCSNGWITTAAVAETDYSNSAIPDPDGPTGMIAPFWEDLSPQEHGEVSYYHDEPKHRFIVEFFQVRQYQPNWAWESFQVVLYDPVYYPTPTGDGEILFQYLDITDPASCTIGIENWNEDDGLQYLFNGSNHENGWVVTDSFAIKLTTSPASPVIPEQPTPVPSRYVLYQNYPNSFNSMTVIRYQLPEPGPVSLDVCNLLGQKIATLVRGKQGGGEHTVAWNGRTEQGAEAASGIYFYRIKTGNFVQVKKMVVLR